MMQGIGAFGVTSLRATTFASAASAAVTATGMRYTDSFPLILFTWTGDRALASEAATLEPAGPSSILRSVRADGPSAGASTSTSASSDKDLPLLFSLRPSVLSPLYSTWNETRKIAQRREHLTAQLKAHALLSSAFSVKSDADLTRKVRRRVNQIHHASVLLGQLLEDPAHGATVARCPSPAHAVAYCTALEELTLAKDAGAHDFARVQRGEVSPWAHYAEHFAQPYRNTPRLEPLEVIFSKPDPGELVRQLYGNPTAAAAQQAAGRRGKAAAAGSAHIDVDGVTHTAGKRKASSATLDLVPGSGQITVNGLPIGLYFREQGFRQHALQPLVLTSSETKYDITVRVRGGGLSGQAQAVRTAVARALCVQQPALSETLEDFTRWDGRVVERKKPGRAKARRGFTWVRR